MSALAEIERKVASGDRLSRADALTLYQSAPLELLQELATAMRNRFHNPQRATYLIMRIINYTNICVALCDYCAFYRLPKAADAYVTSFEDICKKIDELLELGGDLVGFNGGFNPKLKIDWYVELFSGIRAKYGDRLEFFAMTVAELIYASRRSKISVQQAAQQLRDAGVRWVTGGGAEILTDAFRKRHSPLKFTVAEYLAGQAAIIEAGLNTTATMVIGFDESLEERVEHLESVRNFQDRYNGLFSFLSWTYKPYNTELGGVEVAAEEYLRHLAVSRLYLDNIKHIRTSVLTQNDNALRGLLFGADDFDIPIEDQVTELAGATINRDVEAVLAQARAFGFEPVYRRMTNGNSKLEVAAAVGL